jgi:hypothetical protein
MAPDTQALKDWTNLRARAALLKVQAYRTDPGDGPVHYFTVNHGIARQHADLAALRARIEDLEGDPR